MSRVVQVAVPIPGESVFHYSVPAHLEDGAEIGKRVSAPFARGRIIGFIVGYDPPPEGMPLKEIIDVLDEEPLLGVSRLEFLRWISNYYICSLGIVLKAAHPAGLGVRLAKTLKITPLGEYAIDWSVISSTERFVLKTLLASKNVSLLRIMNLVEGLTHNQIHSLRRRKLIEFDYAIKSDAKIKYEKIVSAGDNAPDEKFIRRNYAKAEILKFLGSHGEVPYSILEEIFGNSYSHIQKLQDLGFVNVSEREISRDPFAHIPAALETPLPLNLTQESVLGEIEEAIRGGDFAPFLLHGVTGSGKTEIYLRAIDEAIKLGREALVLVPEISLTPQLVKRFRARFGAEVAVIHSALGDGERFDAWRQAARGEVKIVIGARSAIFAPLTNLGVIVIDEEHETSYKQEESPCYNARDLSLVLGTMTNSVVILGSATPSAESYANAMRGKFKYLSMPHRVLDRQMPSVQVIDMRIAKGRLLSAALREEMVKNFERGRQTILFLNRRGFSTIVICEACGEIQTCPNCSVPLAYHATDDTMRCHWCAGSEMYAGKCPKCGGAMKKLGFGTQRIEDEARRILPQARVARMDGDAITGKSDLFNFYRRLESGEIDVLVGTQMVVKGHDLPGVTLVGVVSADQALGMSDFRAGERTFQLITQVAGRAGRGDEPGLVMVQTFNPEHPSVKFAVSQDSLGFLAEELELREELGYPPFSRLVNLRFLGKTNARTAEVANECAAAARSLAGKLPAGSVRILGPSPSPVNRVKNRFRWQMLLKSENIALLHRVSKKLLDVASKFSGVRVTADVDPFGFV
ncbi:MAG: replication restart helicase PriA [Deltaproteobacteria bacterium]